MSFIPTQQLRKLRCLKCRKYLSHLPIYQSFDQQGCICGRCPVEGNVQKNTIYEEVALLQRFPCCYDENGCLESLYPTEIPHHEKFCIFRMYDCPTRNLTKCNWTGLIKDMWDHFKRKHVIYTMKDKVFEIDLVGNYNENYLLNVEDELYIVNQNNSKNNRFSCNVSCIGNNIHSQNYSYQLTLSNSKIKKSNYVISKQLEDKIVLYKTLVLEALRNPSTVVGHIQIVRLKNNNEEQFAEVQWELLKELECTCCFEYMLPPVLQCLTGHSICSTCRATQNVCPTCQVDFKDTVNITLGNLIELLIYPCKNEGCKFTCKARNIKQHQTSCTFGTCKCPLLDYENCNEEIPYIGLYDHMLNNHYENLLEMDTISIPFKMFNEDDDIEEDTDDENLKEDCFILRYDFRLFKLHYKYEDGMLQWEMQLIGTATEVERYDFEIDVVDSVSNRRICFKAECSSLGNKTEAFAEDRSCIYIDIDQICNMINEEELTYSVRIVPKTQLLNKMYL